MMEKIFMYPSLYHELRLVLLVRGTQLASQSTFLNLLGVKGACKESLASNSRLLAAKMADSILAGELSFHERLDYMRSVSIDAGTDREVIGEVEMTGTTIEDVEEVVPDVGKD
ncbi:3-hydroxy-3-methylglutaryl-coenzyme A reductase 2 [Capsicum baccatum]|uniref:3-hydroxy-3-methylglutaryl-coenzyme A reductase 2 n=1 Tax=Capsicum baccatum TaxID=33114 RepID=A0A2G2XDC4_CAPBA|nr:3-hydroxy-3-methylglutaryl-coenzyme A reductase 2 [Capsicum baccatum]